MIGDESVCWETASDIAKHHGLGAVGEHLFRLEDSHYGSYSYLSALIQAAGMAAGGVNNFGWKFSNVFLSSLGIAFFFPFFRSFAGRRVALLASLFLAGSHYLMSFEKVGYTNLQAYFAMALVLAAAAWAVRTRRPVAFTCLGLAMAFCFYVFPAALYVLPLPILLLGLYDPPKSRPAITRWATLAVGFLMPFPWLLQPGFVQRLFGGTFLSDPEILRSSSSVAMHLASNFCYAAFAHLYRPGESHYVTISYADPLTAALLALGFAVTVRRLPRDRFALFLVLSFLILLLLVGASHAGADPRTPRMFLLLPFYALFAAIGLSWLAQRARDAGLSRRGVRGLLSGLVVVMIGLNLIQAYVLSPRRMRDNQYFDAVFLRVARRFQHAAPGPSQRIVLVTDGPASTQGTRTWTVWYGLAMLREVYALPPLSDLRLVNGRVPEEDRAALRDQGVLVVPRPDIEEVTQDSARRELLSLGKMPCPARNLAGDLRLIAWQDARLPRVCD